MLKIAKDNKIVVATLLTLVTLALGVFAAMLTIGDRATADASRTALPVCVHEDASGQDACLWDASRFGSEHPDAIVFDSGKITFYPHTGELAVWDDKINDVVVYKITEGE
jgi:hypothetical protein